MKKIYFLIILMNFAACGTSSTSTISSQMDYSYLALGDSYTIGESVAQEDRWPVQLVAQLKSQGYKVAPPKIIAKTGWTTNDLLDGIERNLDVQRDFDIVSLSIGVNNQYQGKDISDYEEDLHTLFRKAINHCKTMEKGVFAVSIPDYSVTPFGMKKDPELIQKQVDAFNAVFKRVAQEYNVDFYNITPISRNAEGDSTLVAGDGLHPSGKMYAQWVDFFEERVAEKLKK